jgi:hypothetical protein
MAIGIKSEMEEVKRWLETNPAVVVAETHTAELVSRVVSD